MLGASTAAAAATAHATGGAMAGAGGSAGSDAAGRQHDVDARDTREALLQDQLESVRSAGGMLDLNDGAVAGGTMGKGSAGARGAGQSLPMAALGRPSQVHGRKGQFSLGAALGTAGRKRGPTSEAGCGDGSVGGGEGALQKRARVETGAGSSGGMGAGTGTGTGQRGTGRSKLKFGSFRRLAKKQATPGAKKQVTDEGKAPAATGIVPRVESQGGSAGASTSQSRVQLQPMTQAGRGGAGPAAAAASD